MDEEIRALERAVLRRGYHYAALVSRYAALGLGRPRPDEEWHRVTLVGFQGHKGCIASQGREHYWLVPVHTVAAVADLGFVHGVIDLHNRSAIAPGSSFCWYMWDLEDGWTNLMDSHASPYRPLEKIWGRPDGFRGPMHEELDECRARFEKVRQIFTPASQ